MKSKPQVYEHIRGFKGKKDFCYFYRSISPLLILRNCGCGIKETSLYSSKGKISSIQSGSRRRVNKYSSEGKFSNTSKLKYSKKNKGRNKVRIQENMRSVDKMDYFYGPYRKDLLSDSKELHMTFQESMKVEREANPHWQSIAECIIGKDKDSNDSFKKVLKGYTASKNISNTIQKMKRGQPNLNSSEISPLEKTILRIRRKIGKQEKNKQKNLKIKESRDKQKKSDTIFGSEIELNRFKIKPMLSPKKRAEKNPKNTVSCDRFGEDSFLHSSREGKSTFSRGIEESKAQLTQIFNFDPICEGSDDQEKEIDINDECVIKIPEQSESKSSAEEEQMNSLCSSSSQTSSGSETSSKVSVNEEFRRNMIKRGAIRVSEINKTNNYFPKKSRIQQQNTENRTLGMQQHLRALSGAKHMRKNTRVVSGYAADLIKLSPRKEKIPSVIDGKKIKSTLSPFFSHSKNSRGSLAVQNMFSFQKGSSICSTGKSKSNSNPRSQVKEKKSNFAKNSFTKPLSPNEERRPSHIEELQIEYEKSAKDIAKLRNRKSIVLNFIPINNEEEGTQEEQKCQNKDLKGMQGIQGDSIVKVKRTSKEESKGFEQNTAMDLLNVKIEENHTFGLGESYNEPQKSTRMDQKEELKIPTDSLNKRKATFLQIDQDYINNNLLLDRVRVKENIKRKEKKNLKTTLRPFSNRHFHPRILSPSRNNSKERNHSKEHDHSKEGTYSNPTSRIKVRSPIYCKRTRLEVLNRCKPACLIERLQMSSKQDTRDFKKSLKAACLRKKGKEVKIRNLKRRDRFKTIRVKQKPEGQKSPRKKMKCLSEFSPFPIHTPTSRFQSSVRRRNQLSSKCLNYLNQKEAYKPCKIPILQRKDLKNSKSPVNRPKKRPSELHNTITNTIRGVVSPDEESKISNVKEATSKRAQFRTKVLEFLNRNHYEKPINSEIERIETQEKVYPFLKRGRRGILNTEVLGTTKIPQKSRNIRKMSKFLSV
ncbi:unnamed protein product [Moneuplotes crassus]|uniref:Uncharacterized protein n=1 Tax=Euplotes crassus TaxID=5936 RepID=A0AAD1U5Z8_EUPCR|nr:unnamed protein product [Moneuplotes crassus]